MDQACDEACAITNGNGEIYARDTLHVHRLQKPSVPGTKGTHVYAQV